MRRTHSPLPAPARRVRRAIGWGVAAGLMAILALPASAQRGTVRPDGVYDFRPLPAAARARHNGTLAVRSVKGGIVFDLTTVSPKGTTCSASGLALGGSVLTFRDAEDGFRLTVEAGRITVGGLIGQVSQAKFCGLGARLTGLYVRRSGLDKEAISRLAEVEKAAVIAR